MIPKRLGFFLGLFPHNNIPSRLISGRNPYFFANKIEGNLHDFHSWGFTRELFPNNTSRRGVEEKEIDQNTSGQRGNKFNNSYRDISVIVAENNSVVKPKYQQYTSLNKMLSNFSKVLMAHISFTAVINNGGIGKGIGSIRKGTKKSYIYVL